MRCTIVGIRNAGQLRDERIVIDVLEEMNLGDYLIFASKELNDSKIDSSIESPVWFPDITAVPGDRVVVYTREGSYRSAKTESGGRIYFIYQGRSEPIFVDAAIGVVLLHANDWEFVSKRY